VKSGTACARVKRQRSLQTNGERLALWA